MLKIKKIFVWILLIIVVFISINVVNAKDMLNEGNTLFLLHPAPTIQLHPSYGNVGDEVIVAGRFFPKLNHWSINSSYPFYTIMIDDKVVKTFTKSASGEFKEGIIIPGVGLGIHNVWIKEKPNAVDSLKVKEIPGEWERTYGEEYTDNGVDIVQAEDGGYVVAGGQNDLGVENFDFFVIKTDGDGDVLWNKTYGGENADSANSIIEVEDGYVVAGYTRSYGIGGSDFWVIKIDGDGDVLWNKTYGGSAYGGDGNEYAHSIIEVEDGYVVAGEIKDGEVGGCTNFWVIKIDGDGDVLWNKTYGGKSYDSANSIIEVEDGYVVAGSTKSYSIGGIYEDWWVIKIDGDGDVLWNKTYGGNDYDLAYSIIEVEDGYVVAGETSSYGAGKNDVWVIKIDGDGDVLWNKTYGGVNIDNAKKVMQTNNGNYVIIGTTKNYGAGGLDFWVIKTDGDGDVLWNKTYGGTGYEMGRSIIETEDGKYFLCVGSTDSYGTGKNDVWLVKFKNKIHELIPPKGDKKVDYLEYSKNKKTSVEAKIINVECEDMIDEFVVPVEEIIISNIQKSKEKDIFGLVKNLKSPKKKGGEIKEVRNVVQKKFIEEPKKEDKILNNKGFYVFYI